MTLTYGDVRGWQPDPLGAAGDGVKKDQRTLETARDDIARKGLPSGWHGFAGLAGQARHAALLSHLDTMIADREQVKRALYRAETDVADIRRTVKDIDHRAAGSSFTISDDGTVTSTAPSPTFHSRFEAEEWADTRSDLAQQLADDVTAVLAKAAQVDADLCRCVPEDVDADTGYDDPGTLDPRIKAKWATLTDEERKKVLETMVKHIAAEDGVEVGDIDWDELADDTSISGDDGHPGITWGSWDNNGSDVNPFDNGTMHLNPNALDDPTQMINTIAHELRHGEQNNAADDVDAWHWPWTDDPFDDDADRGITEDQAHSWKDNFAHYKSYDSDHSTPADFQAYHDQPVETDARKAGEEYVNGLTDEDFEKMLEESR